MTLEVRCFHLAFAGFFVWSLAASGVCEARCLELGLGPEVVDRSSAGPSPAEHEASCHRAPSPQPTDDTQSLAHTASKRESDCRCVHADDALHQQRAGAARHSDAFPAVALAPSRVFSSAALQRRHASPGRVVAPPPHRYRNPPLLI